MHNSDCIPIAALNQYAYCPHRCWRMFCAGEFVDNHYTIEGTDLHDRVHTVGEGHREETWQVRAIWLKSERYQLIGKSDLIESESGQLYPVEFDILPALKKAGIPNITAWTSCFCEMTYLKKLPPPGSGQTLHNVFPLFRGGWGWRAPR